MRRLAQSTAARVVLKVFLSSDHVTAATGKTVAVTISKNGALTFSNPSAGATTATEMASGWYYVDLSAADVGTLGDLVVRGTAADCDDSEQVCQVAAATPTLAEIVAALVGARLTVLSPFANGDLTIRKGDSYGTTSGQVLLVPKPNGAQWPSDLASIPWAVTFTAAKKVENDATGTATITKTAVVVDATTVRIDLAATDTNVALGTNGWTWELEASTGLLRNTLISGNMSVLPENKTT